MLNSAEGVAVDTSKVQSVMDWPTPRSVRALHGFLGLARYYRKFIQNYVLIAAPLTCLLKKQTFSWSTEAYHAFDALKQSSCGWPSVAITGFFATVHGRL